MPIGVYPHPPQCGFQKGHKGFQTKEDYESRMKIKAIERKCENCGKIFLWKPYKNKSKGRFCSKACINFKKEKNPNWQGGKTSPYQLFRSSNEKLWAEWRKKVFEIDKYTCFICKKKNIKLDPHHIRKVRLYPELAFVVSNGVALCRSCHNKVETRKETKDVYGIAEMALRKVYELCAENQSILNGINYKLTQKNDSQSDNPKTKEWPA